LIASHKSDGTEWDGLGGQVPSGVISGLATALASPGVGAILAFLASPEVQGALSKPDPLGDAELDWNGTGFDPRNQITLADEVTNMEDTFTPLWLGTRGWASVPLSSAVRVRVRLLDEDLVNDDAIGEAIITSAEIQAAWTAGVTYWVRVEDQTLDRLLAIAIQVTPGG
jgi:hypothetical protein